MNMKICFYNSVTNFRSLSKISVFDKFQLIFIKRFKSLIAYSLELYNFIKNENNNLEKLIDY